jgi:Mg-chelatase subunit ChlD
MPDHTPPPIAELRDYAGQGERLTTQARRLEERLSTSLDPARRSFFIKTKEFLMQRWMLTPVLAIGAVLAALTLKPAGPVGPVGPGVHTATTVSGGALSVSAGLDQGAVLRGSGEDHFLVVSFEAPELQAHGRAPVHLAVVVDTSGSMAEAGKLEFARRAVWDLVEQLGPQDQFSLVGFDREARVVVPLAPVTDPGAIFEAVATLAPGGDTHIGAGLKAGLEQLQGQAGDSLKRVVVLSDGISDEDPAWIAGLAASQAEAGVSVSAFGLGLRFDSDLLLRMSQAGGGRYAYVGKADALAPLFREELQSLSRVSARGVSLQVDLADGVEVLDVYGYEAYGSGHREAGSYRAFVGDMASGSARKVVARVRLPDHAIGTHPAGTVTVRYTDEARERQALTQPVSYRVTTDRVAAANSVNPEVGTLAARAVAADIGERGRRSWGEGDHGAVAGTYATGTLLLQTLQGRYGTEEVDALGSRMRQQAEGYATTPADEGDAARTLELDAQVESAFGFF